MSSLASRSVPVSTIISSAARLAPPVIAVLGLLWNGFGISQFLGTLERTPQSLMQMGMTPEQAAVYAAYPMWMTVAFGIGVFGGLAGSALLLARSRYAPSVLGASLAGYLVLYVGDVTEGVFAALGAPQVAILTTVVVIAAGLLGWSRHLSRTTDPAATNGGW